LGKTLGEWGGVYGFGSWGTLWDGEGGFGYGEEFVLVGERLEQWDEFVLDILAEWEVNPIEI
jgi:hypothetical protein